jgi:hypothetical protein
VIVIIFRQVELDPVHFDAETVEITALTFAIVRAPTRSLAPVGGLFLQRSALADAAQYEFRVTRMKYEPRDGEAHDLGGSRRAGPVIQPHFERRP